MKLNTESSLPLYLQLKQNIKDGIQNGQYLPGSKLPNESDLCEIYGISRITVRRAISELADEGFLERKQGKGTFVKRSKMARELINVNGFTDFSKQLGKNPSKKTIVCEEAKADKEIAESLQIPAGSPVLKLCRVMYIDQEPFLIDLAHYSLERFPNLLERIHEHTSSYQVLENIYNIDIKNSTSKKVITAIQANHEDSEHLDCEIGETLFNIYKTVYDQDQVPIHTSNFKVPASLVAFTITT
jgi:GntR family frlABCD operon transcriptional regulator